jgi:hypothetical protein
MKLPSKFSARVLKHFKKYQSIILDQRKRDVAEADTASTVKDILADIFGYDKFKEITAEYKIRGTFCDLAVVMDNGIKFLIEVKGANVVLTDHHLRQAQNYGALEGINWVILTNSIEWKLFNIQFGQPPSYQEVASFSLETLNPRKEEDLEKLFLIAREGIRSDVISTFYNQIQLFNRFTLAQIILSQSVVNCIRREFRKLFPEIKVTDEMVQQILSSDIIKRDTLEGEKCEDAKSRMKKASRKAARKSEKEGAQLLIERSIKNGG